MPCAKAREHLGLALGQLGDQRLGAAEARRAQQHRRGDRGRALGDPGIGHLQRRRGADRPVDDAPVDTPIAQHRGLSRGRARGIDRRAVARAGRAADDPAIDKIGAGRSDDLADADRGLRADRIAVDIDRLAVERLQRRRQTAGPAAPPRPAAGSTKRNRRRRAARVRLPAGSMPAALARSALASRCAPSAGCEPSRRFRAAGARPRRPSSLARSPR